MQLLNAGCSQDELVLYVRSAGRAAQTYCAYNRLRLWHITVCSLDLKEHEGPMQHEFHEHMRNCQDDRFT